MIKLDVSNKTCVVRNPCIYRNLLGITKNVNFYTLLTGYDADGGVYGDDYDLGVGPVVSYGDYFNKYHGFKIIDNRFSYGGHGEKISKLNNQL